MEQLEQKSFLDEDGLQTVIDTVKDLVTKITAHAEFREYAVKDDNGKINSRTEVSLRNWFDSIHVCDPNKKYDVCAKFSIDAFILTIRPEMKKNGEDVVSVWFVILF